MTSVFSRVKSFFSGSKQANIPRPRIHLHSMPSVIYAIGDIHGCLTELNDLERKIYADAEAISGEKLIIYLGDLIDRGPASAQVLDRILSKPKGGVKKLCIAGNHETAFLQFIDSGGRYKDWLSFGGRETLVSYGIYGAGDSNSVSMQSLNSHVPDEHIDFLRQLPVMITIGDYCFVHAGIDPNLSLENQKDEVLLWSRPDQFEWSRKVSGLKVVHGHTPVEVVDFAGARTNVDIGAYARGTLAALKITKDETTVILSR